MKSRFSPRALLACALFPLLGFLSAEAAVSVSNLFASNMMFQRSIPIKVFGQANAGESVTVTLAGNTQTVTANSSGKWIATLPALSAGGPHTLTINNLTFTDVLVGDVWFCTGQSNIQIKLNSDADATAQIPLANYPNMRILRINTIFPTTDTSLPTLIKWSKVTPDTAKNFSAVGYYFGRDLHNTLNVPIGLIDITRGGTKAEAWTAADTFASHPVGLAMLEYYNNLPSTHPEKQAQDAPGALFPVFVEPLLPFGLKGVLWYQGEHNTGRHIIYHYALSNMIGNWRTRFQQPNLPFVVAQLPNYGSTATTLANSNIANLRGVQAAVSDTVANVEYTANIDLGDSDGNIHPARKQPVGKRAALAALKSVYGQNIAWTGPRFSTVSYGANDATISFDLMGGTGLASVTNPNGFLISNNRANGFVRATAQVIGNTVKLTGVSNPVAVRYAWEDMPRVQLFNTTAALPVAPFRSDTWHTDNLAPATWASVSSKDPLLNEDNDNYPNFVEFFANTPFNSVTNDPIIWSVTSPFANTTAFRYRRRDNLSPAVTYKIQTSPAAQNTWTDLSYVEYPAVAATGQATHYQADYGLHEIHVPGNVKVRLAITMNGTTWYSQGASGGTNQTPTASVSSPTNGSAFTVGTAVTVNAAAADSDGTIAHVELYVDGAKYGSNDTTSPYSWSVTGLTAGTRSFYVIAQDNSGARTTSSTVNISVNAATAGPVITNQPDSLTVAAGANASFGVTATGTALTYLWRQDEAPITATNVTGIESPTLTITGTTSANAGIYSVVVSDGVNPNVVSTDATLTVTPGSGGTGTTINFENTGVATNTVNTLTLGDFVVKGFNGSGGARNLQLPGTAQGFASTAVQPLDSGGRVTLARTDGQPFDLTSFDYAEGIFGTNGDVIVTGTQSGGGTVTTGQLAFTVKAFTTRTVNWTGLTLVTFDWAGAGSTTNAPGTIDNLVIPGATPPPEPPPPAGPYYEAEDYQSLNAEASPWIEVADTTASGGAYMVVPEATGNALTTPPNPGFLDFTFTHPAAGPVYIYVRTYETAASGNTSDSLHLDITTDSTASAAMTAGFTVNDAWKWTEWTTGKPATLPAGTHTLRIHYREDGFRLDRVAISPTAITTLP